MRVRPPIYAFGGILSAHISFGITGNCRYIRSDQRYAVILSGSEESEVESRYKEWVVVLQILRCRSG